MAKYESQKTPGLMQLLTNTGFTESSYQGPSDGSPVINTTKKRYS